MVVVVVVVVGGLVSTGGRHTQTHTDTERHRETRRDTEKYVLNSLDESFFHRDSRSPPELLLRSGDVWLALSGVIFRSRQHFDGAVALGDAFDQICEIFDSVFVWVTEAVSVCSGGG